MTAIGPSLPITDVSFDGELRSHSGLVVLTWSLSRLSSRPQEFHLRALLAVHLMFVISKSKRWVCPTDPTKHLLARLE